MPIVSLAHLSRTGIQSYSCCTLERLESSCFFQSSVFILGYDNLCVGIVGRALRLLGLAPTQYRKCNEQENGYEKRLHSFD
jgi:hypothetical protein